MPKDSRPSQAPPYRGGQNNRVGGASVFRTGPPSMARFFQSPDHARAALKATGWYTPAAERLIHQTPIREAEIPPYAGALFDPNTKNRLGGQIIVPPGFFSRQSPSSVMNVMGHEFGHAFDWQQGGRLVPGPGDGGLLSMVPRFHSGPRSAQDPRFLQRAEQVGTSFPGVNSPLGQPPVTWGGPVEMYAEASVEPYRHPALRQFYPQFTGEAYKPPPGFVRFEDGSIGPERTSQSMPLVRFEDGSFGPASRPPAERLDMERHMRFVRPTVPPYRGPERGRPVRGGR